MFSYNDAIFTVPMTTASSPGQPSLAWRLGSAFQMGMAGSLSRIIMFGANNTDVYGLDQFCQLLDDREDVDRRERGLITGDDSVRNHGSAFVADHAYSLQSYEYVRTFPLQFQPRQSSLVAGQLRYLLHKQVRLSTRA